MAPMGFSPSMVEGGDEDARAFEFLQKYINEMEPAIQIQPSDIQYPQEQDPGFMRVIDEEGNPTFIEQRKYDHMVRPKGGIAQMAPSMMDGYVDNDFVQNSGLPYVVTPQLERLRRDSMNQFQQVPASLLPVNLRGV